MNGNWLVMTDDSGVVLGVSWGEEDDDPTEITKENMEVLGIKRVFSFADPRLSAPTYVFPVNQNVSALLEVHESGQKIQLAVDAIEDIPQDLLTFETRDQLLIAKSSLNRALNAINKNDMVMQAMNHTGERRSFKRVAWLTRHAPTPEQRWWWESRGCQIFEIDPYESSFESGADAWAMALRLTGNKRPNFIVGALPVAMLPELLKMAGNTPVLRAVMSVEKRSGEGESRYLWTGKWEQVVDINITMKEFDL